MPERSVRLVIDRLGADGDGIAVLDDGMAYVPFTLPGEEIEARLTQTRRGVWHGLVEQRLSGPRHAAPACPQFGRCGGCRLQHLDYEAYKSFKTSRILEALERAGIEPRLVLPPIVSPPGSRRRVRLAWRKTERDAVIGFRGVRQTAIVPIETCPVALPSIEQAIAVLRHAGRERGGPLDLLLGGHGRRAEGEIMITGSDAGLDVLIDGADGGGLAGAQAAAEVAGALGCARLACSLAGVVEPMLQHRQPSVRFADIPVALPHRSFLQATAAGEAALCAFVVRELRDAAHVLELFCGLGTFTIPLLRGGARVSAFDADGEAVAALDAAARANRLAAMLGAQARDLARRPLMAADLVELPCDAILLDPPRSGAAAQIEAIAGHRRAERIVYVSCNPASFARDARILVDAGWTLATLQPVDQFVWSAEVELAALFAR